MSNQLRSPRRQLPVWVVAGAALSVLAAFGVQLHAFEELVDLPLAQYLKTQSDTAVVQIASSLTDFGKAHWFLIPSLALFLVFRFLWRRPAWASRALFVFASVAASGIVVDILKVIFGRARPKLLFSDDLYQFLFFRFGADYNSFPSGHTACAIAAGVAMALVFPRHRFLWLASGLLLASTRVLVTAHYLSDVVASATIAAITVLALRAVLVNRGFSLTDEAVSNTIPRSTPVAVETLGQRGAQDIDAQSSEGGAKMADPMTTLITAALIIVTVGLTASLAVVEWYAPEYKPVPDLWLWLPLFLCGASAVALRLSNRVSPERGAGTGWTS